MTVLRFAGLELTALAEDTKPNHAGMTGYRSIETDTGRIHYHNGTSYSMLYGRDMTEALSGKTINSESNTVQNLGIQNIFDLGGKRVGSVQPAITAAGALQGAMQGMEVNGDGTPKSVFDSGENTFVQKFDRNSSGLIGYRSDGSTILLTTRRSRNPFFKCRLKIDDVTDVRLYVGFANNAITNSDTPIGAANHGVIWGFRSTDTNFSVFNNDATTAAVVTSMGVAKDTSYHTVSFTFGTSDVVVVMDDGAGAKTQTLTTRIPGSTTSIWGAMIAGVV